MCKEDFGGIASMTHIIKLFSSLISATFCSSTIVVPNRGEVHIAETLLGRHNQSSRN